MHQRQTSPAGNHVVNSLPIWHASNSLFRSVAQCGLMQGQKLHSSWFQMYSEAAQRVVSIFLTFPKASLRGVRWLCPISASCWERVANDSRSLVFFSWLRRLLLWFKMQKCPFYAHRRAPFQFVFAICSVCLYVRLLGFDKRTVSPIGCATTNGCEEDELHLPCLSYTQT